MIRLGIRSLAVLLVVSATPTFAGSHDASELSADELEDIFARQKTRGLVLAPSGGNSSETTAATTTSVEAEPNETTHVEFAQDEQVNIQVSFDFDSASLRADQKPKLATLCQVMKTADVGLFRIVGHTDASGSDNYNERLSLLRAQEVKRFLVSDCGIAETRLEAIGVGEQFLFDKDDPNADANRRVEFQALG